MGEYFNYRGQIDYIIFIFALFAILVIIYNIIKKIQLDMKVEGLADNSLEMTLSEFMKMRSASFVGRGRKS